MVIIDVAGCHCGLLSCHLSVVPVFIFVGGDGWRAHFNSADGFTEIEPLKDG